MVWLVIFLIGGALALYSLVQRRTERRVLAEADRSHARCHTYPSSTPRR